MTASFPHRSPDRSAHAPPPVGIESLALAMLSEARLLGDLMEILQVQRRAVATEDLAGVDDTIFSAQRVLRTLSEARLKRRTLLQLLGGDPDLALDDLEDALGPRLTPQAREALERLRSVALRLTAELEVNREVLSNAIRSGEDLMRILGGGEERAPGLYGPRDGPQDHQRDHGMIIDRQI